MIKEQMKVSIHSKRVIITIAVCFLLSMVLNSFNQFIFIIIFNAVIALTNLDRIRINKFKAIVISILLSFPIFFFSMFSTWGLTNLIGQSGFVIMSAISGILIYLVNSIYIQMRSFKIGLIATGLFAAASVIILLAEFPFQLAENAIDMSPKLGLLFISWQTLVALGISIGIWAEVKNGSSLVSPSN